MSEANCHKFPTNEVSIVARFIITKSTEEDISTQQKSPKKSISSSGTVYKWFHIFRGVCESRGSVWYCDIRESGVFSLCDVTLEIKVKK